MRRNLLSLFAIVSLIAFGCQKNETAKSDTATTSTWTIGTSAATSTTGTSAASLSDADKDFMAKVAQGGIAEVNAAQLAFAKASANDVKAFGNRMINDHGKANDELKQLATNKGVTLPTETDTDQKKAFDALATKTGKAFDKAYMTDMVKDHETVVAAFEKESTDAQDPDLKSWVTKTLPTIQDHLKMAKQINSKLK